MTNLNERVVGLLRTVVPGLWAAGVAWLVSQLALPVEVADFLAGLDDLVWVASLGGWYAAVRALEPHLPRWLRTLLIGAPTEPHYGGTVQPDWVDD